MLLAGLNHLILHHQTTILPAESMMLAPQMSSTQLTSLGMPSITLQIFAEPLGSIAVA
jgi:hypothetical protein